MHIVGDIHFAHLRNCRIHPKKGCMTPHEPRANRPDPVRRRGQVFLSRRKVTLWLLSAAVLLSGAYLALALAGESCRASISCMELRLILDLNGEATLPVWFSVLSWIIAALMAFGIALQTSAGKRWGAGYWWGLGAVCLFLSADEAAMFHESIGVLLSATIKTGGPLLYSWLLYGFAASFVFGLLYLRLLCRISPHVRWLLVAAGAIYLTGALGFEMLGAAAESGAVDFVFGWRWTYLIVAEEFCEMLGVIVLINALMLQASFGRFDLRLQFRP